MDSTVIQRDGGREQTPFSGIRSNKISYFVYGPRCANLEKQACVFDLFCSFKSSLSLRMYRVKQSLVAARFIVVPIQGLLFFGGHLVPFTMINHIKNAKSMLSK